VGRVGKIAASVALLVGGFILGMAVDDDPPSQPVAPREVVQVPKYIERTTTVEKRYIPEVCLEVAKISQDLSSAVNRYETDIGKMPRILDEAYRAIVNESLSDINDLKSRQQASESDSIKSLLDIRDAMDRLKIVQEKCQSELR
jgi:hypothetical protein